MAEHAPARCLGLYVVAMESIPESFASDVVPKPTHVLGLEIIKLFGCVDGRSIEPLRHIPADSWNIFHRNREQRRRQVSRPPDRQSVAVPPCPALTFLTGNFRKLAIGGEADRTGDKGTDILCDRGLDASRQPFRVIAAGLIEAASQLINRFSRVDRNNGLYFGQERVMRPPIKVGLLWNKHQVWTEPLCLVDRHYILDAVGLASRLHAMTAVRVVPANGTTPIGRPSSVGHTAAQRLRRIRQNLGRAVRSSPACAFCLRS